MLRVFLVDDESAVREMLRDTVPWGHCGFEVVGEAGDGEMALALIRKTRPDVLITDIRMPFVNGLDLSRLIRQEFPQMKIVLMSAGAEFELAQEAIAIGVERYLLKPVGKNQLLPVLEAIKEKIRKERQQRSDLVRFRQEAQDYEQYAHRCFFEQMVAGRLTVQQIYDQARAMNLDLRAQSYAIALVSELEDADSQSGVLIRDSLVTYFLKYPEYVLFRWNLGTYAVLIKGDENRMDQYIRRCVDTVQELYERENGDQPWYVAVGKPTPRLSALPACFEEVSRLWAYRYLLPDQHILMEETVEAFVGAGTEETLRDFNVSKVDPSIVDGVLRNARLQEVSGFVEEYIHSMGDALRARSFCQYLMLSVRFAATDYVRSLGVSSREYLEKLNCLDMTGQNVTTEDLKRYLMDVLLRAMEIRDSRAGSQYRSILKQAVSYIDGHYAEESISLNRVAEEVKISPNYLSAVFSQEMGVTFVEYLTTKRMERARELLRMTGKRSGEVAAEVGYKDPHYFSFLFKKTQGCTPRDYRAGKAKR